MTKRSKLFSLSLVFTVVFGLLAGAYSQTITVGVATPIRTWDPHEDVATSAVSIKNNIYETLTSRDDDMNLVPALAESWSVVSDDTWRFEIRPGVSFHDGTTLTAEDVAFSLNRLVDSTLHCASFVGTIESAQAVGELAVEVVTKSPDPVLPARLSFCAYIVPKAAFGEKGVEGFNAHPIGTGPFEFVSWRRDDRSVMERFEGYWGPEAAASQLVFREIPENFSRVAALEAGEIDIATYVPTDLVGRIESHPNLRLQTVRTARVHFIILNEAFEPLNDVRVRQALNYAVDIPAITSALFDGHAYPLATICNDAWFGCDPDLEGYPYDPEKARELLAEAGYPDGFKLELALGAGRPAGADLVGPALSFQLQEVGVELEIRTYEWGDLIEKWRTAALPMYYFGFGTPVLDVDDIIGGYLDPARRATWYKPSDEAVELGNKAMATFDEAERISLYEDYLALIKEEAPWIFLWNFDDLYGVNESIEGFAPRADETMDLTRTIKR